MTASSIVEDRVVTGEAVRLDLRPAAFPARILAFLVDAVVQLGLLTLGLWTLSLLEFDDDLVRTAAQVFLTVAAFVLLPLVVETLTDGRSLGRLLLGTRVVRLDGGPVHGRQSLLRAVAAVFEIWGTSGGLALLLAMIDRKGRRMGDMLAGTMVIQERLRVAERPRPQVPPSLEAWARTAEVGRLPLDLAREIRTFLPRAADLNPESRRNRGRELTHRAVPFVSPAPPPGTAPEEFLQAVLALRSARDEARLRRTLAQEDALLGTAPESQSWGSSRGTPPTTS
ncbi:RDD family protein [Brachybacterium sp. EF45031]|uniref:RDD family protein n=1 Tax=Brachybacterium sillae TaxID=2810536 RepID=UPI00255A248A|nr:RDD family protein [Brachybacterium sillae]MCS6711019.1 RDD family protein [Brachybacterium sillae]